MYYILIQIVFFYHYKLFQKTIGLKECWDKLSEDEKIEYCKEISSAVEEFVNDKSYNLTQKQDLNSKEEEYKISFKQEIVAKSSIFVAKKKYCLNIADNEGVKPVDPLKVTGLEVVRSDTPLVTKPILSEVMKYLLEDISDEELRRLFNEYENKIKEALPEEIAINVSVNGISVYTNEEGEAVKGAPYHIKGAINQRKIIKQNNLYDKIDEVQEGNKVKVVYLKPNRFNIESLAFDKWSPEFDKLGLEIDKNKMIEKIFRKKILMFLKPLKKEYLLEEVNEVFSEFFI